MSETPASSVQIGGDHYREMAIQPSEFIQRNGLNWCEGNVIKYVARHRNKNGAEDIRKAIHYLNLLLEWEYPEEAAPLRYPPAHPFKHVDELPAENGAVEYICAGCGRVSCGVALADRNPDGCAYCIPSPPADRKDEAKPAAVEYCPVCNEQLIGKPPMCGVHGAPPSPPADPWAERDLCRRCENRCCSDAGEDQHTSDCLCFVPKES